MNVISPQDPLSGENLEFPTEITSFFYELLGEEVVIKDYIDLREILTIERDNIVDRLSSFDEDFEGKDISDTNLIDYICTYKEIGNERVNIILDKFNAITLGVLTAQPKHKLAPQLNSFLDQRVLDKKISNDNRKEILSGKYDLEKLETFFNEIILKDKIIFFFSDEVDILALLLQERSFSTAVHFINSMSFESLEKVFQIDKNKRKALFLQMELSKISYIFDSLPEEIICEYLDNVSVSKFIHIFKNKEMIDFISLYFSTYKNIDNIITISKECKYGDLATFCSRIEFVNFVYNTSVFRLLSFLATFNGGEIRSLFNTGDLTTLSYLINNIDIDKIDIIRSFKLHPFISFMNKSLNDKNILKFVTLINFSNKNTLENLFNILPFKIITAFLNQINLDRFEVFIDIVNNKGINYIKNELIYTGFDKFVDYINKNWLQRAFRDISKKF